MQDIILLVKALTELAVEGAVYLRRQNGGELPLTNKPATAVAAEPVAVAKKSVGRPKKEKAEAVAPVVAVETGTELTAEQAQTRLNPVAQQYITFHGGSNGQGEGPGIVAARKLLSGLGVTGLRQLDHAGRVKFITLAEAEMRNGVAA